jgi:hypothetical protein
MVGRRNRIVLCLLMTALVAPALAEQEMPVEEPPSKTAKELPWEKTHKPPLIPGRKMQNAKELLELLGVDTSQWSNLFHDQLLGPADEERIDRILFHLPRIGGENTHHWRKSDWKFEDIAQSPDKFQGEFLHLKGRATKCERIALLPELVDRYEYDHYYRVTLSLGDDHTAIVCARFVPSAWTKGDELDEPALADAIFLKTSPVEDRGPQLVCAALRVAWLPDRVDEAKGVDSTAVLLAQHGFDVGLWDLLHGRQKRGLEDADREPFYRLLGVVQDLPQSGPALRKAPPVSIATAVKSPEEQTGRLVTVDGTVQRIDRIEIESNELRIWTGLDHYYTLYVFVPLLKERIGLQRSPDDKNPRIFDRHFPVTVCVPELPAGLEPSANVHEHVRVHGVFFKVWTYKPTGEPGSNDDNLLQPSPLVIAPAATLIHEEVAANPTNNILGGVLFVLLIAALGVIVWRMNRSDAQFKREVLDKKILKEDQVDLSRLEE